MATPIFTNNPRAAEYLRQRYIQNRWNTPFVTDTRMSKAEAHARAFAAMRARMGR